MQIQKNYFLLYFMRAEQKVDARTNEVILGVRVTVTTFTYINTFLLFFRYHVASITLLSPH